MYVDLNLEEDELNVLEFCVDHTLEKWEKDYVEWSKEKPKSGLEIESREYYKDWINIMKNILKKIEPLQEAIEKQYNDSKNIF